ncbi:hypothetical protein B0H14DRAFT_1685958 [Mycena olivaceomarginata]|nr:hypothetical protein B0H14DRAFT_1685958 [Mycena olivaceomarginata]
MTRAATGSAARCPQGPSTPVIRPTTWEPPLVHSTVPATPTRSTPRRREPKPDTHRQLHAQHETLAFPTAHRPRRLIAFPHAATPQQCTAVAARHLRLPYSPVPPSPPRAYDDHRCRFYRQLARQARLQQVPFSPSTCAPGTSSTRHAPPPACAAPAAAASRHPPHSYHLPTRRQLHYPPLEASSSCTPGVPLRGHLPSPRNPPLATPILGAIPPPSLTTPPHATRAQHLAHQRPIASARYSRRDDTIAGSHGTDHTEMMRTPALPPVPVFHDRNFSQAQMVHRYNPRCDEHVRRAEEKPLPRIPDLIAVCAVRISGERWEHGEGNIFWAEFCGQNMSIGGSV